MEYQFRAPYQAMHLYKGVQGDHGNNNVSDFPLRKIIDVSHMQEYNTYEGLIKLNRSINKDSESDFGQCF